MNEEGIGGGGGGGNRTRMVVVCVCWGGGGRDSRAGVWVMTVLMMNTTEYDKRWK